MNSKKARDIAIGLFESARDGATGIDPFKYTVRQWVLETFRRLTDSAASEALTGTSLEGKSEAYRREKAVWDAAFMRVAKPLSLGAFLKQIEAYDKLFDLWEGK